jgi:MFS family permease
MLFGFDISSMSGVLGTQAYTRYFDNPQAGGYTQGAITASMPAGSLVGALGSSYIADRFSRKIALQVSCVLWIIGAIIQCASVDRGMLCAGRVVGGMFPLIAIR